MNVSSVPAVLSALVESLNAALTDDQTQIIDGQPVTDPAPDVIAVGFTGIPGEAGVESVLGGRGGDMESYDIHCLASSWRGATDPVVVRERAFALVGAVALELARDQSLGGLVMRARVSARALASEQTTEGATATVAFTVHVEAQAGM